MLDTFYDLTDAELIQKLIEFGSTLAEVKQQLKSYRGAKRRYWLQRTVLYDYFRAGKFHSSEFRIWHRGSKINKGECVILHHLSSDIYLEVDTIYFDKQGFIKI